MSRPKPRIPVPEIETFGLEPGDPLAGKFTVIEMLGAGWEGEVFLVEETLTRARRAAKIFFPQRNVRGRAVRAHARKLHRLAHCPHVVKYVGHEETFLSDATVTVLVSDFVAGEVLEEIIRRQPGKKFPPFEALHLFAALTEALASVHAHGEHHGDLHGENIMVARQGLGFSVRLLDPMLSPGRRTRFDVETDLVDLVRMFPMLVGGDAAYKRLPPMYKSILGSMRRDRVLKRFRTTRHLLEHLRHLEWE